MGRERPNIRAADWAGRKRNNAAHGPRARHFRKLLKLGLYPERGIRRLR